MRPLLGLRELAPPARRFLSFSTVNVVSWQCLVGQPLVLFGRSLDMPPAWVGVLIAMLPLSMLLVLFTGPLVAWLGPRRLLTWGWLLRNLLAASIVAIPWALHQWGKPGGWGVLLLATLGFCVFRALSVAGWFPWLHEVVPPHQRGVYLACETALAQVVTVLVVIGCGLILGQRGGLAGFYLIYGVGIVSGLASLQLMRRIPGGLGQAAPAGDSVAFSLAAILGDRNYQSFLTRTFFALALMTAQGSIATMYLRDILAYSDRRIMALIGAGSLVVALTIGSWSRRANRHPEAVILIRVLLAHAFFALTWLALLPGRGWTDLLALAAVIGSTVCLAAFTTITTRDMLGRVSAANRIAYTSIWITVTSLATGLVPILAGLLIGWLGLAGFRFCFLLSGLGALAVTLAYRPTSP